MSRQEFSKPVKRQALARAKGICEGCRAVLTVGKFHFDHDVPCALGGKPELVNAVVLCLPCHRVKTTQQDVPSIARAVRLFDKANGIRKAKQPIRSRPFQRTGKTREAKQMPPRRPMFVRILP